MSLAPIAGHEDLRRRLRSAVEAGRLPQSLLFHGPTGIGKQRLALWLAALVLCEREESDTRPCGSCRSCRLASDLQHPDVHWFFPLPAPTGASTPQKRRQKLEDARLEELASRREKRLWPVLDGSASIFLAAVNEIRHKATRRPAMGSTAAFVIGGAERMVPQASSPEAANAFLKLLEEPPPDTLLFLTSSRPGALLPTIRSRVLSVRVTPPDEQAVTAFLTQHAGIEERQARRLARRTDGSVGLALRLAEEGEQDPRQEAVGLVESALNGGWGDRLRAAARYPSYGARGAFSTMLEAMDGVLRDAASASAGAEGAALDPEVARRLPDVSAVPVEALLRCARHVDAALSAASGNGNPQAIVAVLLADLAGELRS